MRTFCLTVHAPYACAHAGACCSAGWDIPVEPEVRDLVDARQIRARAGASERRFVPLERPSHGCTVAAARQPNGECVFFEPDDGRLCAIHRAAGPELLPSACRHFPRVVLRDARGTFVTLSHFCPTAAALLEQPGDLAIVEAPVAVSLGGRLEGLDATAVLPPLLRPGLLSDLDGYAAWERAGIAVLGRRDMGAGDALDMIASATREVCDWRPGTRTLTEHVARSFARHADRTPSARHPRPVDHPARMFLAAHLFANWGAYQGSGLEEVVQYLRDALALLMRETAAHGSFIEAAGAADLRLRHHDALRGRWTAET